MAICGRSYANGIVLKNLLAELEKKSILSRAQITQLLDASVEELKDLPKDLLSDEEHAAGARMIGLLHIRK